MSLRVNVREAENRMPSHRLGDLCSYLDQHVVRPRLAEQGVHWEPRFEQFFLYQPGSDPFGPTGTIEFYVPPMFLGQVSSLESAIREALNRLGIRTGAFAHVHRRPGGLAVKVIQIPILEDSAAEEDPPEVNMPTNAGRLVLRDLLGYQAAAGRYRFTADDMLRRLATLGERQIESRRVSPFGSANGTDVHRVRGRRSPMTFKRIRRCLGELSDYARWAKQHRFQNLEVVLAPRS